MLQFGPWGFAIVREATMILDLFCFFAVFSYSPADSWHLNLQIEDEVLFNLATVMVLSFHLSFSPLM